MSANGSSPSVALRRPPQPNLRHGVYAARVPLSDEEEAGVESLLALPHVVAADRAAAEELVRIRSLISQVDDYLASGSIVRCGRAPTLVDHRRRLSAQLVVLLEHFGLTPKARSEWARSLAASRSETLGERISRRLRELRSGTRLNFAHSRRPRDAHVLEPSSASEAMRLAVAPLPRGARRLVLHDDDRRESVDTPEPKMV